MAWLTPTLQAEQVQNLLSSRLWFYIFFVRPIYGARCNLDGKRFFIMGRMKLPNYTQIPNYFIENMHNYPLSTIAIFLVICRKTIGWHKQKDRISYSQIMKMTGMSMNGVRKGIEPLIIDEWIIRIPVRNGYVYDLNFEITSNGVPQNDNLITESKASLSLSDSTKEKKEIYIHIETTFQNKYEELTNQKYHIHYAKDRAIMKPLIKKYGEKKIIELIDIWFNDSFAEQCGYSIGGFSSCFNRLLILNNLPGKVKEKDTRKALDEMEALRQDKKLHPEKYKIPKEE